MGSIKGLIWVCGGMEGSYIYIYIDSKLNKLKLLPVRQNLFILSSSCIKS